jgi:hypothetical protein
MAEWNYPLANRSLVHLLQRLSVTKEAWKDNRFLSFPHDFFSIIIKRRIP